MNLEKELAKAAKKAGLNPSNILDLASQHTPHLIHRPTSTTDKFLDQFITQDKQMQVVKEKVRRLAKTNINILLIGETGTGKELLAQALHGSRFGPFMAVNSAGIKEELLEAELFGCVKGAFTGAIDRVGYFEYAENGTIFLDEIGDMPKYLQCKLLRVIENKEIRKLGSNDLIKINCRIIAATNFLELKSDKKQFRPDLFHRLGVVIHTKPLRERRQDIRFISDYYDKEKKIPQEIIMNWLNDSEQFPFHGNCRELKNMIDEYLALEIL